MKLVYSLSARQYPPRHGRVDKTPYKTGLLSDIGKKVRGNFYYASELTHQ